MDSRRTKRDAIVTELSVRLARVCQHLTDDEFERLVADMADMKLRFAAIDASAWGYRTRSAPSTAEPLDGPPTEL